MRVKRAERMPDKFIPLADYNAEVYRGITHTAEYDGLMRLLQLEWHQWVATQR